jgi:hypothetical protein
LANFFQEFLGLSENLGHPIFGVLLHFNDQIFGTLPPSPVCIYGPVAQIRGATDL